MRHLHFGWARWNRGAALTRVRFVASLYDSWQSLQWESIMNRVATQKDLTPGLLETAFRQLSLCRFRPHSRAMHRDLNYLASLCTSRNAISYWTPHKMALVFSSCSMLGYLNPMFFGEMWKCMRAKEMIREMDSVELATLVKAMGFFGRTASNARSFHPCGIFFGVSELLLEVMKELTQEERLLACTDKRIVDIWTGLGRLRFYDATYLNPLAKETMKQNRLQHYNEASVANLLLSTAVLKYKQRHFITMLIDACTVKHRVKCYSEQDLVMLYQALSLLAVKDEKCLTALDNEMCRSHRLEPLDWFNPPFMKCIAQEATQPERRAAFAEELLDDVPKAFAKAVKQNDDAALMDAMTKTAEAHTTLAFEINL